MFVPVSMACACSSSVKRFLLELRQVFRLKDHEVPPVFIAAIGPDIRTLDHVRDEPLHLGEHACVR